MEFLLFSIGDYLEVPEQLEPGDYVLSFRWDCEQTSQERNFKQNCCQFEIKFLTLVFELQKVPPRIKK